LDTDHGGRARRVESAGGHPRPGRFAARVGVGPASARPSAGPAARMSSRVTRAPQPRQGPWPTRGGRSAA
jgi:hypothetical protein